MPRARNSGKRALVPKRRIKKEKPKIRRCKKR